MYILRTRYTTPRSYIRICIRERTLEIPLSPPALENDQNKKKSS